MNRSSRVSNRLRTALKVSASVLTAGIALFPLTCPASAGDEKTPASSPASAAVAPGDDKKIDFIKDVKPIFLIACMKCHGLDPDKPRKKAAAGFRLDNKAAALKGGKSGVDIIPGNSVESRLFKLLSGPVTVDEDGRDKEIAPMPKVKHGEKWKALSDDQIAVIQQWIDQGANWPE